MARNYGSNEEVSPLDIIRGRLEDSRYTVLKQGDIVTVSQDGQLYMQINTRKKVVTPLTPEAHNRLGDFMDRCRRNGLDLEMPFDNH